MKDERSQLVIILFIVFIGFIGTSMPYPIFPPLFLHPSPGSLVSGSWIASSRSILLGIALAAYPLGQFIGLPILGSSSDRYGRKPVLMISLIGSLIGYCLSAISLQYNWLWPLIISRFLTGLMEGNIAIVRAIAANFDSMSKHKSFGRINGASSLGFMIGPMIGGFLSDKKLVTWFSFATPFYIAAVCTAITLYLAQTKLKEPKTEKSTEVISLWQQFNLIRRFQLLFQNPTLKYLLVSSSVFTLAVDIFYEFGPVYLTGTWLMSPAWIAIYNLALCFTLAFGHTWLSYWLSLAFTLKQVIIGSMITTAFIFGLIIVWPSKLFVFILFTLGGLSISSVTNTITIQISNTSHKTIQGEVMGAQVGLRMLGDALLCLVGGFIIISSVALPLIISSIIALVAAGIYASKSFRL